MSNQKREEQFSKVFSRYGNRIVTQDDNYLNQFRATCQETLAKYTDLDIYFDIIDNSRVNAVATKYEGSYFIAISKGTIKIFEYYARKFSANPNILSDFGPSNQENNVIKLQNSIIIKDEIYIIEEDPPVSPITKERRTLAELIFSQSILNIIFHELGHIVNGHIDFLESSKIHYLEEVQTESNKLTSILSLHRQTLEIDADAFSAIETLREMLAIFDSKEDKFKEILPNYRSVFKLWSFVRQMCWRIMENNYIGKGLLEITHPPTSLRSQYTRIANLDLVKGRGGSSLLDDFETSYTLGVSQADNAFRIISEMDTIPPVLSKELSNYHFHHGALIFCHWDFIREDLLPLASYSLRDPNIRDDQYNEILKGYKQVISRLNLQT
ncbi:hypothetical protein AAEU33_17650 [Chryseobacterium sp. Chry.R1]|uniref:hypothetical protein n=1 Tax=Chryseobacterium sp. Chry.R1 TaxID=3139392 RepID=UPI0031F7A140